MPKDSITEIKIADTVGKSLTISGEKLGKGGDGVVFKGYFDDNPTFEVAVKFYLPLPTSLFTAPFRKAYVKDFEGELERLRDVAHPNLQRYISCGKSTLPATYFREYGVEDNGDIEVPFIVTKYVDGHSLDTTLKSKGRPPRYSLVTNLLQMAVALQYLHHRLLLHGDIKIRNVLIEKPTGDAVLIDFGLSKSFSADDPTETSSFLDPRRLPPSVREVLDRQTSPERTVDRARLKQLLFPALDLYHFGLLIDELLEIQPKVLNSFDRAYLEYVSSDLKSWSAGMASNGISIKSSTGCITTARQLVERIKRLEHGPYYYQHMFALSESEAPQVIMRPEGPVEVRHSIAPLLAHPTLRRLHNLSQLSLVRYIYPSATQSRFDHLLSVLGVCQRFWKALSRSPKFLFHMERDDVDRMEILALLHDINHFPFLHYFQEAGIPAITSAPVIETFLKDVPVSLPGSKTPNLASLLTEKGIQAKTLQRLISDDILIGGSPSECIIKSVINGGIDADKLAYLRDDARTTGLPFGLGVDVAGLLDEVDVAQVPTTQGQLWHIIFPYTAIPAIESVCFARYWNFQRIYWHHTNRAVEAMIIWTIQQLYRNTNESALDFLEKTKHKGDASALEYLAQRYWQTFRKSAPIAGLTSDRNRIYKRVFELPMLSHEQLLSDFRDEEHGLTRRTAALAEIHDIIQAFAKKMGYSRKILEGQVLLDIPLRKMNLGGPIYVKTAEGEIKAAVAASPLLELLNAKFGELSKVLRVFVSPRIRDEVGKNAWHENQGLLRESTMTALVGKKPKSEVQ